MAGLGLRRQEPRVARGRPPRVSAQDIVAAAIDMGLSRVTLAEVAKRLGVTVPALYRHVRNRDEIVKLAAIELAMQRGRPGGDTAQAAHWAEVVRGCAHGMVALFSAEPQLICEVMNGTLGPDGEMDFVEQFLAALTRHGFTPAEGIRIHHAVAMLAIGAAVSATAMKSGYAGGQSHAQAIRAALGRRSPAELPLLRESLPAYLNIDPQQWQESLEALVAGIAARRGEAPPINSHAAARRGKSKGGGKS